MYRSQRKGGFSAAATKEQEHSASSEQNIASRWHWKGVTLMCSGLAVGLLAAAVHTWFYLYCDGKVTESLSQQKWVIRGGTALATIVKIAFALSTATAYTQILWLSLSRQSATIGSVDSVFGVSANVLEIFSWSSWMGRWDLLFVALVTWLMIPVPIITPGSITIIPGSTQITANFAPPRINFTAANFLPDASWHNAYPGFGQEISHIANAVAFGGQVLPMEAPVNGSSYKLDFLGPTMSCGNASADQYHGFRAGYKNLTHGYPDIYYYIAWAAPTNSTNEFQDASPIGSAPANPILLKSSTVNPLDYVQNIFVYNQQSEALVGCSLQNATYSLRFNFPERGPSSIALESVQHEAKGDSRLPHGIPTFADLKYPMRSNRRWWAYYSLLGAYAQLVLGYGLRDHYSSEKLTTQIRATSLGALIDQNTTTVDILATGLEDLFTNMTLSLFSASSLLEDPHDAALQPVSITRSVNFYDFTKPGEFFITYGLAFALAIICVVLGCLAIHQSGCVYSTNPSTLLRVHRDPMLIQILSEDTNVGAEPKSEGIKDVKVLFRPRREDPDGEAGKEIEGLVLVSGDEEVMLVAEHDPDLSDDQASQSSSAPEQELQSFVRPGSLSGEGDADRSTVPEPPAQPTDLAETEPLVERRTTI